MSTLLGVGLGSRAYVLGIYYLIVTSCAFCKAERFIGELSEYSVIRKLLTVEDGERFLWYVPHGGFGNQIISFRNALRLAGILNRTLIVPPLMIHGESEHRVCHTKADEIRWIFWHFRSHLLYSYKYVSMADVVDISEISEDLVRTFDLRLFAATRCGVDVSKSLSSCGWCQPLIRSIKRMTKQQTSQEVSRANLLLRCGIELGAHDPSMSPGYRRQHTVYNAQEICLDTAFVYLRDAKGELLAEQRAGRFLEGSCPQGPTSRRDYYLVRNGNAVNRKYGRKPLKYVNVVSRFGAPEVASADVLSLGSTFFYFDMETPTGDSRADALSCATEFLAFHPEIMRAAVRYVERYLPRPFACLHFRGGDGDFSLRVQEQLQLQVGEYERFRERVQREFGVQGFEVFFMSDMASPKWQRRFNASFRGGTLHFASRVQKWERTVRVAAFSTGFGVFTNRERLRSVQDLAKVEWEEDVSARVLRSRKHRVDSYLEQAICSCAELGFLGHGQSTFTANVERLRLGRVCSRLAQF